jgi:Leucine-rich repeat (LRR) protein
VIESLSFITHTPNLTTLYLNLNKIDKLQKKNLKNVQRLYLSFNELVSLDDDEKDEIEAVNLDKLELLDVSNNFIKSIEKLTFCPNLLWLDLNENQIEKIDERAFQTLKKLKSIKISKTKTNLSYLLFTNKSLVTLDSSWNTLNFGEENQVEFDTVFRSLQEIRLVGIEIAQNTNGNISLKKFLNPNLTSLDFSNNPFLLKANDFGNFNILKRVKTFEMRHCHLTSDSISSIRFDTFKQLIKLDLSYNNLTQVESLLVDSLEYLDLSHNQIEVLDERFFSFSTVFRPLKYLNLENNRIYFIADSIYNFINLATAKLSNNCMEMYPYFDLINNGSLLSTLVTNNYEFYFDNNRITSIKKASKSFLVDARKLII